MNKFVVMKLFVWLLALAFAADAEVLDFGQLSALYKPNASVDNIIFTLYTRRNGNNGVRIYLGDKDNLAKSGFDPKLPVKMVTHGFSKDATSCPTIRGLRNSFLARWDCNVISVDWSVYGKNVLYEEVALAVKIIGAHVSKFVKFLRDETKFDIGNLHAVGHSLGAQVISYIGYEFPKEKVWRITGLDPAGPIFENSPPSERLDPEDAKIVDVIHTSMRFLGVRKPIGTVDFYPNGGNNQPGCAIWNIKCQHDMSHRYFIHTVASGKNYAAVKCDSLEDAENGACCGEKAPMGIGADTAKPGIYYAEIKEAPPTQRV